MTGLMPPFLERGDQGVGVIALVGEERLRLDLIEQRHRLCDVGSLTRRKRERHGIAERVDDRVDLGRRPTARSADGLAFAVFF